MKATRRWTTGAAILCGILALAPSEARGEKFKDALLSSLRDPATWIPAAGAFVFAATGQDGAVSAWALRETPVFGSPERALQASSDLRTATHVAMLGSTLLRNDASEWRVWSAQFTAALAAANLPGPIKGATGRTRPDESDEESFPSSHAAAAFAYAALGSRNIEASDLPRGVKRSMKIAIHTMAAATAWARVEGGVHYPSDVLAGAALGNFVSTLINDTLLPDDGSMTIGMNLSADGGEVRLTWRF